MIQENNNYRVLKVFLDEPLKGFRLREISRKLKLGLPSVSNYVNELEKEKLIVKRDLSGNILWFANRTEEIFKKYKISDNILSIESGGLTEFLNQEYQYPTIILFGSYGNGENTENSDIDLCIISQEKKEVSMKKFEDIFKREIQTFVYTEKNFKDLKNKNPELLNSILNGIKLRGFIKI